MTVCKSIDGCVDLETKPNELELGHPKMAMPRDIEPGSQSPCRPRCCSINSRRVLIFHENATYALCTLLPEGHVVSDSAHLIITSYPTLYIISKISRNMDIVYRREQGQS